MHRNPTYLTPYIHKQKNVLRAESNLDIEQIPVNVSAVFPVFHKHTLLEEMHRSRRRLGWKSEG